MKKIILEGAVALPAAGLMAYFGQMLLPIIILVLAMLCDLGTGLAKAWTLKTISSQVALLGVLKKAGSIAAVGVGVGVDLLLPILLDSIGIQYEPKIIFGLLVIIWLAVNEFISVLENLSAMGVPFPPFLEKIVNALKQKVEKTAAEGGEINERNGENDG